jgi:hypothetical protein
MGKNKIRMTGILMPAVEISSALFLLRKMYSMSHKNGEIKGKIFFK